MAGYVQGSAKKRAFLTKDFQMKNGKEEAIAAELCEQEEKITAQDLGLCRLKCCRSIWV